MKYSDITKDRFNLDNIQLELTGTGDVQAKSPSDNVVSMQGNQYTISHLKTFTGF